ncbi:MAG: flagellar basal body-associated FliL family protein [Xanthobacteraceae bacterium]|nr:flagellar basal body-associated FliL family protein [Xanthobacteraceae bacterium]
MASKVTTAPADLEETDAESEGQQQKSGSSFLGGLLARCKGLSRKQLILIAGGLLGVVLLGGVAAHFLAGSNKEGAAAPKAVFYDLPDMIVNLAASTERPQYLKLKITLEVENSSVIDAMKPAMPRVLDTFQVHLRELRAVDLEGSAGLFRLREELTRRVNHAIAPARIRAVLFKEIVVQ